MSSSLACLREIYDDLLNHWTNWAILLEESFSLLSMICKALLASKLRRMLRLSFDPYGPAWIEAEIPFHPIPSHPSPTFRQYLQPYFPSPPLLLLHFCLFSRWQSLRNPIIMQMPSLTIKVEFDILTNPILKIPTLTCANILAFITLRSSSVGSALSLLPNGHQFESPQGHWRFTRSLTSGPYGISRDTCKLTRTSTVIKNKNKIPAFMNG